MAKEQTEKKEEKTAVAEKPQVTLAAGSESNKKYGYWWGTGRRKTAVARVRVRRGAGEVLINDRPVDAYFTKLRDKKAVFAPLEAINAPEAFDIFANVKGGGMTGQAGAVVLGIARALKSYDENLIPPLREGGYLTRDPRETERKKYGQRGARRRFQFSKR